MLVALNFEPQDRSDIGILYKNEKHKLLDKELDVLVTYVDTEHPHWAGYFETNPEKINRVSFLAEYETGFYVSASLNFHNEIEEHTKYKTNSFISMLNVDNGTVVNNLSDCVYDECISTYGVCDNVQQVKDILGEFLTNDIPIVVSLTVIRKSDQPEDGGWRWHKWGKYIGTQISQNEYLRDEPEIEEVLVYHIHVLTQK